MDDFEQLRRGQASPLPDRPLAAPVAIEPGWAELERLAAATDRVIARIDVYVSALEGRYGGGGGA